MQGGDPSGVGDDGRSIYTEPPNDEESTFFKDEFDPLLRPTRRGLLMMANLNLPDTNTSQFCITFGPTPELYKKNTVFGKIDGETVFNLLKMEQLDVDENDRPVKDGIVIERIEILENPFDDIFPRDLKVVRPDLYEELQNQKNSSEADSKPNIKKLNTPSGPLPKPGQIKKSKKSNLLSFGEED